MAKSKIEWTESTWNPLTGCSKVSPGCKYCYAERMAKRLQAIGLAKYRNGFKLTLHRDVLTEPLKWMKPQMIFVNSMSDLFHQDVPFEFIQQIFAVMRQAYWHTFQILTKRAERLLELSPLLDWPENVWMGVSVESSEYVYRIRLLRKTDARTKFLSCEPLLSPLPHLPLEGIQWVIVGGESGPNARPMKREWVIDIRNQCQQAGVAFFFKQWGGPNKRKSGRKLEGRTWNGFPEQRISKRLNRSKT